MLVLRRAVMNELAGRTPRAHHRDLAIEIDERFQHGFLLSNRRPRLRKFRSILDSKLALAVVPVPGSLQNGRQSQLLRCARQILRAVHPAKLSHRKTGLREERFLAQAMLRDVQHVAARPHWSAVRRSRRGLRRNILKLERDHRNLPRELADRVQVFIRSVDLHIRNLPGRRILVRRKRVNPIAHPSRGNREHPPQLPAAKHPDCAARQHGFNRTAHNSLSCMTESVCRARHCFNRVRISGYLFPRMLAANNAALVAPALPIASVPTGIPAGICTIESRESMPFNVLLLMGTPNTGSVVWAATIPGKCAAPPAAATITSKPRSAAVFAYSAIQSGVRCAETTLRSCGMPNAESVSLVRCSVSQSDLLPMISPTSALSEIIGISIRFHRYSA